MTVRQVLDLAEQNDLPVVAANGYSAGKRFDPKASRAYEDTASVFSYRAEIKDKPATISLSFHPATRRLHTLTIRWAGISRDSEFAVRLLAAQSEELGRPAKRRELFNEDFVWKDGPKDWLVLRLGASGTELAYLDGALLPSTAARRNRATAGTSGVLRNVVLLALGIGLLRWVSRRPEVKGWWGELKVKAVLLGLDRKKYRILHDVTLPTQDGTTQIDHIIVSPQAVFVVETKNYSGWIFGSYNEAYWTWKKFRRTEKFQNPLRQNFKHQRALVEVCGVPEGATASVIVFVGSATFKTEMPANVIPLKELVGYVQSGKGEAVCVSDVEGMAKRIADKRLAPGLRTHVTHVRHVKEDILGKKTRRGSEAERREADVVNFSRLLLKSSGAPPEPPCRDEAEGFDSTPPCPRCGSATVRRVLPGSQGDAVFWRCLAFPKCGGTVRVEPQ